MIRNTHNRYSKTDPLIGVVGPQWLKTMVYSVTREPKRGQIPKVVIVGPISDNDSGSQVKVLLDEKSGRRYRRLDIELHYQSHYLLSLLLPLG